MIKYSEILNRNGEFSNFVVISGLPRQMSTRFSHMNSDSGEGDLFKRRNSRDQRVLIQLPIFKKLLESNDFDKYEKGYIVYLKPDEYFDENGERKTSLPEEIEIGVNSIIFFEFNHQMFDKYYEKIIQNNWKQVIEHSTKKDDWSGHFAVNITQTPQKKSFVVRTGTDNPQDSTFSWMPEEVINEALNNPFESDLLPGSMGGKGLGIPDYDYAPKSTFNDIKLQMAFLWQRTLGYDEYVKNLFEQKKEDSFTKTQLREIQNVGGIENFISITKRQIDQLCQQRELNNIEKLIEIGAFNDEGPICPLCLVNIKANELVEKSRVILGRESAQHTTKELLLMHIESRTPGELLHKVYNLAYGHELCNTIQGSDSIKDTIERIKIIIQQHELNV